MLVKVDLTTDETQGWRRLLRTLKAQSSGVVNDTDPGVAVDAPPTAMTSQLRRWIADHIVTLRRITIGALVAALLALIGLWADLLSISQWWWPATTLAAVVTTTTPATPSPTPAAFTYGVTVLDAGGQPIPHAQVLIEIQGQAPLENTVDERGYARLEVPASHAERPGRLRVYANGFEAFDQNIDIYQDRLPNEVQLIAPVVGNTTGFCPDNLTFDLIERMTEMLKPYAKIRVERLNCAIKQQGGSETAMRIGSRKDVDASIVIWGVYVVPPDPEVRLYFDIVNGHVTQ